MQWGSWICSQAVIEGLTVLALGCTGGKLKQPEMMGRVLIKTCLSLPFHSWAQRNGSVPRSTSKGAPRGCLTSSCPQPGGAKLLGLAVPWLQRTGVWLFPAPGMEDKSGCQSREELVELYVLSAVGH